MHFRKLRIRLACSLEVAGCAVALTTLALAQIPNAPISSVTGSAQQMPAAMSPAPATAGDASIRLGSGDLVEVNVYDVPELTTKTRVSDTGDLYLPLVNYVHVDGLTIADAAKVIERRLQEGGFVNDPHVQLFVSEYTSDGANLLGEVVHPGVYPVLGDQTLFSLLSAAGGLSDRAGQAITITHRGQPDKPVEVKISRNLQDHAESNIPVAPGDTIIVRRADIVYIVGDVARPSGFLMDNGGKLSVLQAIALAGGTNPTAKLNGARIIRKSPTGVTEVPVQLKKLLEAKAGDVPLQGDDILFVPASARKVISGRTAEAALQMATAVTVVAVRP